jgi:Family of unknown function (DUF6152)
MNKWTMRFVVLCGCLLASASVYAHHSLAGVYDLGKEAKITGTFVAFRLVNPHSSLRIDAKDKDGKVVEWAIIGGSVTQISRLGLGRTADGPNALHPGDELTVTIVPAIDGKSPVGLLRAITYPDGHTLKFGSPDQ